MSFDAPIASFETTLTDKISSTATTIAIDSVTDDAGNSLDGLVLGFIIDKGTADEEFIIGTVDANNSQLTSCLRGISTLDGTTEVTALKKEHRKKRPIEITAHPYLTRAIRMLNGTDATLGVMKNPSSRAISDSRHLTDKEYVDAAAASAGGMTQFMVTDAGGLNIDIASGYIVTADGIVEYAGETGFALADDSVNYVEVTPAGDVVSNTTGFTVGYIPIAKITTASGDITVNTDTRGWVTSPAPDTVITDDLTYGATIAALEVVYVDTSDAKWKLADASAESTADGILGIALDAGVDTDTDKRVQIGGLVTGLSGLTAGWVFLSDTAGQLSSSAGTYKRIVGYAINATTMVLIPAISADELTGGNSSLTVAQLNNLATAGTPKFGGDGSDGSLDTSGGTVDIDLGSAAYVEKQYADMNIVTNNLTVSNPHAEGTLLVLRCQGDATISASIIANCGAAGGSGGAGGSGSSNGVDGNDGSDNGEILDTSNHYGLKGVKGTVGSAGAGGAGTSPYTLTGVGLLYTLAKVDLERKMIYLVPAAGGGGGAGGAGGNLAGGAGGDGGRGGGALIIEVGGDLNFTGTIDASGTDGQDGSNGTNAGSGAGSGGGGGGGGGAGGHVLVLYNSATSVAGTIDVSGGTGGDGGTAGTSTGSGTGGGGGGGGSAAPSIQGTGGSGGSGGDNGDPNAGSGGAGASSEGGNGSNGTNGSGGSSADKGGGGGGGGGGASGEYIIEQNIWF